MVDEAKLNVSKRLQVSPVTLAVTYPSGGLTVEDARTLTSPIFALQGEWRCQIGRDGCGEPWAAIGTLQTRAEQLNYLFDLLRRRPVIASRQQPAQARRRREPLATWLAGLVRPLIGIELTSPWVAPS